MRETKLRTVANLLIVVMIAIAAVSTATAQQAVPMLINYEGELNDPTTGEPVTDGSYDMLFRIYDVETGGNAVWEGTHTAANGNAVEVANGLFSVILGSGTGNAMAASVFNGPGRWLEVQVGTETLSPRQRITSAAFSIVADNSRLLNGSDSIAFASAAHTHGGADITSGTVAEARIDAAIARDSEIVPTVLANDGPGSGLDSDTVDGMQGAALEESAEIDSDIAAHAGNASAHHARYTNSEAVSAMGAKSDANPLNHDKTTSLPWGSITSIPAGFADGVDNDSGAAFWSLTGNSGTSPRGNLLGTTDNVALELHVNNARALRLEPAADCPNIVAGHEENAVTSGVVAATISGGGATDNANLVTDDHGTVGGGEGNRAGDNAGTTGDADDATVGGGYQNTASGTIATVGGGGGNTASDFAATVSGGTSSTASGGYATVGGGRLNIASGRCATVPGGFAAEARSYGQHAYASGSFMGWGAAQTSLYVLRRNETPTAWTWTELFLDAEWERMNIPVGSTWVFEALVVGRTQDGGEFLTAYSAGFRIRGVIQNAGGTTTMPGATGDVLYSWDPSWNAIAEANDIWDALVIKVKGGSDPMRWVATVRTTEVMFPE